PRASTPARASRASGGRSPAAARHRGVARCVEGVYGRAEPRTKERETMARPEPAPDRDTLREDEFPFWDGVVEREGNRGQLEPSGKIGGYYGALLNAPGLCFHINAMGRIVRNIGNYPGSYSHA